MTSMSKRWGESKKEGEERLLNLSSYTGSLKRFSFILKLMIKDSVPFLLNLNLRLGRQNRIYNSSRARDKYVKTKIWKEMSQHVKVGRGTVTESLNFVTTWLLSTSQVFCNGHISLSWKENKNLQTLKVIQEGQPKCTVCCADCTLHNTRGRPVH